MLSEKAKGKQRAIEPPVEQNISAQCSSADHVKTKDTPRDLLVRFTEGAPDLIISVDKKDSVRDIKQRIRETRQELTNRRLRLIHSGRLLTDGIFLYSWLTSLEERQRRAHTDDEGPGAADIAAAAATAATTWIHCSVGPAMTSDEQKDEEQLQTTQIQPVRGFDRLASVGFSQEDIDNIRRQFHDQSSANLLDHDFDTEEEYDEHARALEEQWIDSIDNAGTATLSRSSSSGSSILQGVLVGFFFPFLPLAFMRGQKLAVFWEDGSEQGTSSSVIFSRRKSMGLVVGFLLNILFGTWRYLLESS